MQKENCQKKHEKEPTGKEVMSCGNLLNHGDILLHQSQKRQLLFGGDEFKFYREIRKTHDLRDLEIRQAYRSHTLGRGQCK
jgi:hypothetical protein